MSAGDLGPLPSSRDLFMSEEEEAAAPTPPVASSSGGVTMVTQALWLPPPFSVGFHGNVMLIQPRCGHRLRASANQTTGNYSLSITMETTGNL